MKLLKIFLPIILIVFVTVTALSITHIDKVRTDQHKITLAQMGELQANYAGHLKYKTLINVNLDERWSKESVIEMLSQKGAVYLYDSPGALTDGTVVRILTARDGEGGIIGNWALEKAMCPPFCTETANSFSPPNK